MTDEQILELVKEHFEEDWDDYDGWEWIQPYMIEAKKRFDEDT